MAKKEQEKKEEKKVEIIRGRMPVVIAAAIKFGEPKDAKDADLAAKYRTTNGKVSDIRKGRNFAYIKEDFKPTKEMVEAAKEYIEQLESFEGVMKIVKAMGVATEEEAAAFEEARKSTRKPKGKPRKAADDKKDSKDDDTSGDDSSGDSGEDDDDLDGLLD